MTDSSLSYPNFVFLGKMQIKIYKNTKDNFSFAIDLLYSQDAALSFFYKLDAPIVCFIK